MVLLGVPSGGVETTISVVTLRSMTSRSNAVVWSVVAIMSAVLLLDAIAAGDALRIIFGAVVTVIAGISAFRKPSPRRANGGAPESTEGPEPPTVD
jgi:hypothetical protein